MEAADSCMESRLVEASSEVSEVASAEAYAQNDRSCDGEEIDEGASRGQAKGGRGLGGKDANAVEHSLLVPGGVNEACTGIGYRMSHDRRGGGDPQERGAAAEDCLPRPLLIVGCPAGRRVAVSQKCPGDVEHGGAGQGGRQ